MTLTPGNVSMLLALLSSIAPGTLAIVAGILGALVGYFGKRFLKQNECRTCKSNLPNPLPRRDPTSRITSPGRRKKSPAARGD